MPRRRPCTAKKENIVYFVCAPAWIPPTRVSDHDRLLSRLFLLRQEGGEWPLDGARTFALVALAVVAPGLCTGELGAAADEAAAVARLVGGFVVLPASCKRDLVAVDFGSALF